MSSVPNFSEKNCVECGEVYRRKPNEGVVRFEHRTFCGQTCCRAFRKRTMNRIPHPEDVQARVTR